MASYKSYSWSAILMLCHLLISFMLLSFDGAMKECGAATFTFKNQCGYTVWPGILSNAGSPLLGNGGFKLESGQSASLEAPEGWSGRVWGRTGCSFAIAGRTSGASCVTGDCAGRLQCSGAGAETPATLAEFTLASGGAGNDFYDVSLVDGFNLPIAIIPTGIETGSRTDASASAAATNHCGIAGCAADLNRICPAALQLLAAMAMVEQDISIDRDSGAVNSNNVVVGCKSACDAFGDPRFCCSGAYANPSTCSPSSYAQIFKSACPAAYSYAFDDPTSTFTCNSGAHYSIVYCPSSSTSSSSSQRSGQSSLVGTQAYASETSTSAPSTSAPARRLLHLAVHVILLPFLARAW